ncbi:MAG TPA: HAD-IA family hydrolase, partial [Promineifilum sp.]
LDGVITDTAEYHFLAWKRLADEEGLPFDRLMNERCRGVSRRESLMIILNGKPETEERVQEYMARKQGYYEALLDDVSPTDLLPGVADLLDRLDEAQVPYAIASASKNARVVCERLGITGRLGLIADGNSVEKQKPFPFLFRFAAAQLGVPAARSLVVEDAEAGVQGALSAGMPVLALGPADRFHVIAASNRYFIRRDDLQNVSVAELVAAVSPRSGWHVVQDGFDAATQHHMETVYTLGNGYMSTRGTFEEGYPGESSLTFVHGVWDDMPLAFTELVNLPNWLNLRITVDGEEFRLDRGRLLDFRRYTDLRQGISYRSVAWQAPNGKRVDLHFERFAAYHRQHVAAIRMLATAVGQPCRISVSAGIDGQVANQDLLHLTLNGQAHEADGTIWLEARTRHTGREIGMAAAVTPTVSTGPATAVAYSVCPGLPSLTTAADLDAGQTLQIDKLVAIYTDRDNSAQAGPVAGGTVALARQELTGQTYDSLVHAHLTAWDRVWQEGDVIIEGDDEAQLAMRFNLFHLLIAAPQHDDRVSIGAKTLSGYGYRGHVFWDTEIFMLPYLIYNFPRLARNMLMYRYHGLDGARRKAAANGYTGASFPWESAETGDEVTPRWLPHPTDPTRLVRIWTGDLQIHITADIAYAIMQYWRTTGDDAFMRDQGAEIILDGARFWADRAEAETSSSGDRVYALRDVIGPDEYHDHVDNNSYTNYMCRWHLQTALEVHAWLSATYPETAAKLERELQLSADRLARWQDVIEGMTFLMNPDTGLIDQFENFFELKKVEPDLFRSANRSLQLVFGIEGASERQVLKQADVIMLLCLFRDQFDRKTWETNWHTYMAITDHRYGSSLGPSFHAWAACEIGSPDEAYEHFMLAALADLRNPRGNAEDGIHAASTGGVWQAAIFGFAGLRHSVDGASVRPRLPRHWRRLAFRYRFQGVPYSVDIRLGEGGDYRINHEAVKDAERPRDRKPVKA